VVIASAVSQRRRLQVWSASYIEVIGLGSVEGVGPVAILVVVAVPTDLIDTPVFSREVPLTSWSCPALRGERGACGAARSHVRA
jgi:hypothetical protein